MREPLPMRCVGCGHILEGLPENRCPECGQVFDPDDPRTLAPPPERGRWYLAAMAVCWVLVVGTPRALKVLLNHLESASDWLTTPIFAVIATAFSTGLAVGGFLWITSVRFLLRPRHLVADRAAFHAVVWAGLALVAAAVLLVIR